MAAVTIIPTGSMKPKDPSASHQHAGCSQSCTFPTAFCPLSTEPGGPPPLIFWQMPHPAGGGHPGILLRTIFGYDQAVWAQAAVGGNGLAKAAGRAVAPAVPHHLLGRVVAPFSRDPDLHLQQQLLWPWGGGGGCTEEGKMHIIRSFPHHPRSDQSQYRSVQSSNHSTGHVIWLHHWSPI